ncbi:MAG: hypothetical protein ACR2KG_06965 [Nocardioidaceae bacterium]
MMSMDRSTDTRLSREERERARVPEPIERVEAGAAGEHTQSPALRVADNHNLIRVHGARVNTSRNVRGAGFRHAEQRGLMAANVRGKIVLTLD